MNIEMGKLLLRVAVMFVASSKEASDIVATMRKEGRKAMTAVEEERLNADSAKVHTAHAEAIEKAKKEGR